MSTMSNRTGLPSLLRQVFSTRIFVYDAAFPGPAVVVSHVGGRSECPEPDFARSVSAEDGAVLDQDHRESLTGCSDCAAEPRQAASDHDIICLQCDLLEAHAFLQNFL